MCDVSVIIVCMNRPDNLYPCLESLRLTTTKVSYETFVVAYLYDPEGLERAKHDFPGVTFIESNEIRGFSENNNLALRQASGEYCFILNDDTELIDPVIDTLYDDFTVLPAETAIVSPKLLNADGSLQLCGRPPYPAIHYVLQQFHLFSEAKDSTTAADLVPGTGLYRTWNITGAAFMIRTEIFRRLGWFDERFFFTPEDIALGTLACANGYRLYVDSSVTLIHKWRTTASRMMRATRPAAVRGSLLHFSGFRRWKYTQLALPVWCAETAKRLKAWLLLKLHPSEDNRIKYLTFRNITKSIFTTESPKELFIKYYQEILEENNG